jgi:hypothetical protein
MKTALIGLAVALPMVLFFGIMIAFVDGHLGASTVLLAGFAICAVTVTAFVFHGRSAGEGEEEEA